jgi:hypothetical protein
MNSRVSGEPEDWKESGGTAWDDNSLAKLLAKISRKRAWSREARAGFPNVAALLVFTAERI